MVFFCPHTVIAIAGNLRHELRQFKHRRHNGIRQPQRQAKGNQHRNQNNENIEYNNFLDLFTKIASIIHQVNSAGKLRIDDHRLEQMGFAAKIALIIMGDEIMTD